MSLLKYPGGKEQELPIIIQNLPQKIDNYFEPFVGGGTVYLNIQAENFFINDKSEELVNLYNSVKEQNNDFFSTLEHIEYNWNLLTSIVITDFFKLKSIYLKFKSSELNKNKLFDSVNEYILENIKSFSEMFQVPYNYYIDNFVKEINKNLISKFSRMCKLEKDKGILSENDMFKNIECAFKSAFYMHCRYIYNHFKEIHETKGFQSAIYLFIRDMCYSSMFRYNANGDFNVPYGGISYNNKSFKSKIKFYKEKSLLIRLNKTKIYCLDFYDFLLKENPDRGDFIFLDPPYDTEFSSYARNEFNRSDQKRLSEYLINECVANFMLIIKNTDYIKSLYPKNIKCKNNNLLNVKNFQKNYLVSFKNRNDKNTEHLLITNY